MFYVMLQQQPDVWYNFQDEKYFQKKNGTLLLAPS